MFDVRLKIVLVLGFLKLGGAEKQALELARFLTQVMKAKVQILALSNKKGRISEICDQDDISWGTLPFYWALRPFLFFVRWPLRFFSLFKLVLKLKKERPDVIISYTWLPNLACALTWKLTGARYFIWNQRDGGYFLNRSWIHRLAVFQTPVFVSNSEHGKEFLRKTYGVCQEKINVIRNGVSLLAPLKDRARWRKLLCLREDSFIACMLANIHKYKDHLTLLKAWRRVVDEMGREGSPVLVLAGWFDDWADELKKYSRNFHLNDHVRFLGEVTDIAGLLNAVDLCVHSSSNEGCPNGVLEAMAAGLPVVGTDIPGMREALGERGEEFLTLIHDHEAMARKIIQFCKNKNLGKAVGRENRLRIEKEFTVSKMCEDTWQVLLQGSTKERSDWNIR